MLFLFQLWRALRLVIDAGLHSKGMSRQEGLDLLAKYAWDTSDIARKEMTRYQSGAGQATAYMIGQLTIQRLRNYAENMLKHDFNLKEFHYQVERARIIKQPALFTHAIFGAIFVPLLTAIFVAHDFAMKIASVNKQRFLCDLSPRYRRGFEHVRNFL